MGALSTRAEAATVLFTDLVDSTAIRAALGEERADDLRREHDRLIAEAVGGHGGRVVKSMGDGVFAVFSSSADALAAAVAVQQAMHHYSRSAERLAELAVRVGVSVGDVVHEQGDCHGMPVVEAARLMAAARGGQILCSELVRLMARGRGGHELTPVGALDLKGIAEPVPACELLWKPLAEPAEGAEGGELRALPAQLAVDLGRVFVSRRRELKTLLELFAVEGDSRLTVAWLLGPPGIGKTRLAAQAAQLAHQQGATVLFGRCDEHQRAPHQPFLEVLRAFADATADDALTEALGPEAAHLSRLHPALAQRCPALAAPAPTTPELDQYRLHEAVRRWLAAASAERPLVLVLDDVHWAEPATLGLLRHLTASAEPSRTVLLCTARNTSPDDNDELALLIDELTRTGASRRLELDGLSGAAVAELLAEATARTVDAELEAAAQRLADWSGGNPLFLRSLVDAVREGADLDGDLPRDVQAAARARLSRLPAPLVELLRVASFLGLEFELPVLAAAVGRSDDEVFDALEEAARSQVVEEVALDRYRFVHALVRAVLPAELSAGRRARIHLQAARAIEAVHPDDPHQLVALAHHYAVAARDDATVAKAVRATLAAAEQATRQSAHEQAVELHRQAVELLGRPAQPDERAQCEAAVLLGEAQRRAGHTIAAMATLAEAAEAAARLGDRVPAARAALAYEQTGWPAGMLDAQAVRLLRQAIALAEPADLRSRAVLAASLGRAYEFNGQRDEARRHGEEASALGAASGD
ncbi:MAG: ATP-binding protein, partial [Acidimicrobiales bacterium]